jgi:hypothetical protein
MNEPITQPTPQPPLALSPSDGGVGPSSRAPARTSSPCAVADTMRRVHAALRAGAPPSYEALLAFGTPEPR